MSRLPESGLARSLAIWSPVLLLQALLIVLAVMAWGVSETGWYLVLLGLPLLILSVALVTVATPARVAVVYAVHVRRAEGSDAGRFAPLWVTRLGIRMLFIALILLVTGVILFSVGGETADPPRVVPSNVP